MVKTALPFIKINSRNYAYPADKIDQLVRDLFAAGRRQL